MPSCLSDATPYVPVVNAIAPSTPSGASLMMKLITRKNTCASSSIRLLTRCARSPSSDSAEPNSTENTRTCRMSPFAKASVAVSGMIFSRNAAVSFRLFACSV